jgi:hypothetical protein
MREDSKLNEEFDAMAQQRHKKFCYSEIPKRHEGACDAFGIGFWIVLIPL